LGSFCGSGVKPMAQPKSATILRSSTSFWARAQRGVSFNDRVARKILRSFS
jgi:hypothetical protein